MAEYNGSIELISGLIQKNKADFPLIEANAVAFYEDGKEIRLPEKLQAVGISQEEKNGIIQSAVDQAHTNTTIADALIDMDKNSTDVVNLNKAVAEIDKRLTIAEEGDNGALRVTYNEDISTLYLHTGDAVLDDASNVISQTIIKGGGGGAAAAYNLLLQQDDEKTALSVLKGRPAVINFTPLLTRIEDDSPANNEKITLYLYVNDALKATYTQKSNEKNHLDVSEYLITGFNVVKLTASYSEVILDTGNVVTSRSTRSWSFDAIEMFLESNFSDATVKEVAAIGDKVTYTFTPYGNLSKTIYFKLGDDVIGSTATSDSDRSKSFDITVPGHGAYPFEVWCTGMVEEELIESEHLYYNIMFAIAGDNTPIVRMIADSTKGQQYSTSIIKYTMYKANSVDNKVTWTINDVPVNEVTVDRTEQTWTYKPTDYGTKKLSILYNGVEYNSVTLEIAKFPHEINPITAKLDLDFNPTGRTNQDADFDIFKNNVFNESGAEKPLTWTLSDNFDWVNGGWQRDEEDNTFFCVKAGTTVTINYNMFADPNIVLGKDGAMGNGKEFKLVFKTTNVANVDATFLKCVGLPTTGANEVGLEMKVHHGYVKSNSETLEIPYAEEDIVEFDFNINPAKASNGVIDTTGTIIPMVLSYEDGVPFLPMTYTSTETSFTQNNPVPITIGSPDCDVHIYRMKSYSSYLTNEDVLNNYIADARSGEAISDRYLRNQIYVNGALTPEGLAAARPDLKIIKIKCPYFTNDKDTFVGDTSVQMIHVNGDPALDNWTFSNGFHSGQGTSSNKYGDAGRNIDLLMCFDGKYKHKKILEKNFAGKEDEYWAIRSHFKSTDGTINITDGTGKVGLTRTSVPTSYFNIKVNIASSENANNALLAKRFDRYLPYTSVGKKRDPYVKNTMEFVNCVVFLQEYDTDITKHREFQDTNWHFYALGNIGDSKKTDQTRTYDPDDTKEFVVEILDNNMPNAAFQTGFMDEKNPLEIKYPINREDWKPGNVAYDALYSDDWGGDYSFEMRYKHPDISSEQKVANIAKWNEFYEWVIMASDEEFKNNLKNWVNLTAAYYYYLFTERYTMMDNRAKNSFWHWAKMYITQAEVTAAEEALKGAQDALKELQNAETPNEEAIANAQALVEEKEAAYNKTLWYTVDDAEAAVNEGYRFDWWDYDNDTSLGIDNSGTLRMPYGKEDIDTEIKKDGTENYYFNAGNSVFYRRLRELFPEELRIAYNQSETSQCFSAENLIKEFDAWQNEFPEAMWIQDYERKYARTYRNGTPDHLNKRYTGRKKFHRRQWERDQEGYMASKYRAGSTQSGFEDGNQVSYQILMRCKTPAGVVVPPKYEMDIIPYSDMYLNVQFGPNYIETVRAKAGETYTIKSPFEDMTDNQVAVFSGKRIQSIGDISTFYPSEGTFSTGEKLKTLIIGNGTPGYANSYLTKLTTSAKNKLLEYLDIQNLTSLKTVYLQIQNLKHFFAQGSGISEAVFANNGLLEEAHLPATISSIVANNLYYLNNLTFEGYNALNKVVFNNCPNVDVLDIVNKAINLKIARLININWELPNTNLLNQLLECSGVQADGITAIPQSVLTGYVHVPSIRQTERDAYAEAWPELTVEADGAITQYVVTFNNYDGSYLGKVYVDEGSRCPDPIATGVFNTPTKPSTAEFDYTFSGWDGIDFNSVVTKHITATAKYSEIRRKYSVVWYNGNIELQRSEVEYGQGAIYEGEIPVNPTNGQGNKFYLFDKWDTLTSYVTENISVKPIWVSANPYEVADKITTGTALNDLEPVEIYALVNNPDFLSKSYMTEGDYITLQLGSMPTYSDNIEEERVLAENYEFDGNKYLTFNDIQLFNEDKDFTIAIDFTPGYTTSNNTYLSCGNFAASTGIRITQANGAAKITWTQNPIGTLVNPSGHVPTETTTYREICVLRHKKGDNNLYIYTNNRYSKDAVQLTKLLDADNVTSGLYTGNYPLVLGADLNNEGLPRNIASHGKINYAKIWFKDLGDDVCRTCCSWIYTKINFDFCGKNRYFNSSGGETKASFICQDLLDETYPVFLTSATPDINDTPGQETGGWGITDLRTWMNEKLFAGISLHWKQIIQESVIKSMRGGTNKDAEIAGSSANALILRQSIRESKNYLYLPALAEVNTDINAATTTVPYFNNELTTSLNLSSYPLFGGNDDEGKANRIKYLGGDPNKPYHWTLRSPYYPTSYQSTSPMTYWLTVSKEGIATNSMNSKDEMSNTTYYDSTKPFGICPCFSI